MGTIKHIKLLVPPCDPHWPQGLIRYTGGQRFLTAVIESWPMASLGPMCWFSSSGAAEEIVTHPTEVQALISPLRLCSFSSTRVACKKIGLLS